MAKPKLQPQQQLPSLESAIAVKEAFHRYSNDTFAELGVREAELAEKYIRKDLTGVLDAQVLGDDAPVIDTTALARNVVQDARMLRTALSNSGVKKFPNVAFGLQAAVPTAEALLNLASASKDPVVLAIIPRLRKTAQVLTEAHNRAANGGHESFDNKTAAAARSAWRHLDNAYDLLGLCMRNADVSLDPIYAARPHTPTNLRLTLQDGNAKPKGGRPRGKGKRGAKKKDSGSTEGGTSPTDGGSKQT